MNRLSVLALQCLRRCLFVHRGQNALELATLFDFHAVFCLTVSTHAAIRKYIEKVILSLCQMDVIELFLNKIYVSECCQGLIDR